MHHSISMKTLHVTHWNVSERLNKFQLCTYHLTVITHQSNYVYGYVRYAKFFRYKAIFTLENQHFGQRCIIQYRWKLCTITHWNVSERLNKFQLCTYHLTVITHQSNYVYGYVIYAKVFRYKAIFTLENQHFGNDASFNIDENCTLHIEMFLKGSTSFSFAHII